MYALLISSKLGMRTNLFSPKNKTSHKMGRLFLGNQNSILNDFMKSIKNLGIKIFVISPVLFLFLYWYVFSVDIPWYDDVMIIAFNRNILTQGFNYAVFKQLIANYNEHILVVTKLIFWLNYTCLGNINLRYISLQGILIYSSFIYLFIRQTNRSIYSNIIILFTLSSLMYNEGYLWAMTSIQNFASLLFTLISIILIADKKIKLSLFFLVLGLISSAQTLIFIPILILIAHYHEKLNWKLISILILLILFYFSGYEKTGVQPDIKSLVLSFNTERILNILNFYAPPFGSLGTLFNILFSASEFILSIYVFYQIILEFKHKTLSKRKIILASLLLWSSLILYFTFLIRVELESRYLIYANVKTACLFLYMIEIKSSKKMEWSFSFAAIIFYFITLFPAILKAKNTSFAMNGLKQNLIVNKMIYSYSIDNVDARKINPYYKDLNKLDFIQIPNRLNGRNFNHLLLFNQISNEQIRSQKFKKESTALFNLNISKAKLLAKKIRIDSLSSFVVYQNKIASENVFEANTILLKSDKLSIQFNYSTDVIPLPTYILNRQLDHRIVIYKNMVPYGQYDMYLISNSGK